MSEPTVEEPFDENLDLDLDAALPVEAEAKRTTRVRVNGRQIELPMLSEWPLRAIHLADNGDLLGAFECVIPDDSDFLADLPGSKSGAIMEHLVKLSGVTPGESSRSARSSRSGGKKSRRT